MVLLVVHFGTIGTCCWHTIMAYNLYRWVCMGDDQKLLHKRSVTAFILYTYLFNIYRFFYYLAGTLFLATVLSVVLLPV